MAPRLLDDIAWDGQFLLVEAEVGCGTVHCKVPRETIWALRIYSDIIVREIPGERRNIVAKLRPFLMEKLSKAAPGEMLELLPWEVDD